MRRKTSSVAWEYKAYSMGPDADTSDLELNPSSTPSAVRLWPGTAQGVSWGPSPYRYFLSLSSHQPEEPGPVRIKEHLSFICEAGITANSRHRVIGTIKQVNICKAFQQLLSQHKLYISYLLFLFPWEKNSVT